MRLFVAVLLVLMSPLPASKLTLYRVLLNDTAETGAVCLDGSPAGWFERRASSLENRTKWHIHFQGGGWGIGTKALLKRIQTRLGTSKVWPESSGDGGGLLSSDPTVNPVTGGWNLAHLYYCDGGSFSGDRDLPLLANGTKLFFRGRRILSSVLSELLKRGLEEATEVLITGGSAGALSTFLHANYIASRLASGTMVAAAPLSGFFLDSPNAVGQSFYEDNMRWVFDTHNATAAVVDSHPACLQEWPAAPWKCLMAPHTLQYMNVPVFVVNSLYDSFQIPGILALGHGEDYPADPGSRQSLVGWSNCTDSIKNKTMRSLAGCGYKINSVNAFRDRMVENMTHASIKNATVRKLSGAFLHSCVNHVEGDQTFAWENYAIEGTTMQEALRSWYADVVGQHEAMWQARLAVDCRPMEFPYSCNPSCAASGTGSVEPSLDEPFTV